LYLTAPNSYQVFLQRELLFLLLTSEKQTKRQEVLNMSNPIYSDGIGVNFLAYIILGRFLLVHRSIDLLISVNILAYTLY
jgi:UDP-N-acetyl-D-mannosaminuronic acid transferase (WecB/TagA/CpsF family)